jgi:hypothetical protein
MFSPETFNMTFFDVLLTNILYVQPQVILHYFGENIDETYCLFWLKTFYNESKNQNFESVRLESIQTIMTELGQATELPQ